MSYIAEIVTVLYQPSVILRPTFLRLGFLRPDFLRPDEKKNREQSKKWNILYAKNRDVKNVFPQLSTQKSEGLVYEIPQIFS